MYKKNDPADRDGTQFIAVILGLNELYWWKIDLWAIGGPLRVMDLTSWSKLHRPMLSSLSFSDMFLIFTPFLEKRSSLGMDFDMKQNISLWFQHEVLYYICSMLPSGSLREVVHLLLTRFQNHVSWRLYCRSYLPIS